MDPNPKAFPILSYVLPRFRPRSGDGRTALEPDLEQPEPLFNRPGPDELELVERLPGLTRPDLLSTMALAVSDVAAARALLRTLGPRPDHETVDEARAALARTAPASDLESGADPSRSGSGTDTAAYEALVRLDEMHAAYEELLRTAEEALVGIYDSSAPPSDSDRKEEMDEEVVRVLAEADGSKERVDLSGRGIRYLPEALGRIRGLLVLDLSGNQLEAIPDAIAGLENLQELYVSSNLLTSLPDSIGLLTNLKILDVSGNKLKSLPETISRCRSLVELDASFNNLTYLPTNIGLELHYLQKLTISLNKIRSLPSSICEMRSLRVLEARFNELRGLPHAIGNLMNLEILDISGNFSDLTVLPLSLGDLANLRELDLSNNQIHALPDTFGRLEKLEKLNLDGNPIEMPPAEVVGEGVVAVKDYMLRRWLELLEEEEMKAVAASMEASSLHSLESPRGWLARSTSWLGDVVHGVISGVVSGNRSTRDPCLDQQL